MTSPSPKLALWQAFCAEHRIAEEAVPLFATDERIVQVTPWGQDRRLVLTRSPAMEAKVVAIAEQLTKGANDIADAGDGMLYMMLWLDTSGVVPLYIGKAGRIGVKGGLSANLRKLSTDKSKFGRWGSNYAYHIGDLSAVVCEHEEKRRNPKYAAWAERLFESLQERRLRHPVWFWATIWGPWSSSIWREYAPCGLAFQEYLLIGVASDLFPDALLNREGVNRVPTETPIDPADAQL